MLGVGEHSSVSLCTVLFTDMVQNLSGLDSPFTGLSDSIMELQSMKRGLRAECTVPFPPVVRQPKVRNLGRKHVLLPFSGQDSLLEGYDAGRAPCLSVSSSSAVLGICLFGSDYLGMSCNLSLVVKSTRCERYIGLGKM